MLKILLGNEALAVAKPIAAAAPPLEHPKRLATALSRYRGSGL
jgi:hypothetical protein